MINKVTLIGLLGKDPDTRMLEGGARVSSFSIATNESYKDKSGEWQTQTEWHSCVCWNNWAQRAEEKLKKGFLVYAEGKLRHRTYEDQEGRTQYRTDVVLNYFRILKGKEAEAVQAGAPKQAAANVSTNSSDPAPLEDDLPF